MKRAQLSLGLFMLLVTPWSQAEANKKTCQAQFYTYKETDFRVLKTKIKRQHLMQLRSQNLSVSQGGEGYYIYPMVAAYIGEDEGHTSLNQETGTNVEYFKKKKRELKKISVSDDGLIIQNGKPLSTVDINYENKWDIVMSKSGDIYIFKGIRGRVHHSSVLAGGPVAAAGMAKVTDGRLKILTSQTQHYPEVTGLFMGQLIKELKKKGADLSELATDIQTGDHIEAYIGHAIERWGVHPEFFVGPRVLDQK